MLIYKEARKKNLREKERVGFLLRLGSRVLYTGCIQVPKFGELTFLF